MKLVTFSAVALTSLVFFTGCGTDRAVSTTASSSTVGSIKFTPDPGTRVPSGVSTFAYRKPDGEVLLYDTSMGIKIYRSSDGLKFTDTGKTVNPGFDPTVVALPKGNLRMYAADIVGPPPTPGQPPPKPQDQQKQLISFTSDNGLDWSREAGVRQADVGFGVPLVVPISDGQWRLYYCGKTSDGKTQIRAAQSTDGGLKFRPEKLTGIPPTYVDPSVIQLDDGSWFGVFSTNPGERRSNDPQQIYTGTSADGLSWKLAKKPLIAPKGTSALDPTLLKLSKNKFRVYYSSAKLQPPTPGKPPINTGEIARVKSGVITIG